jgi:MOSC domain-containing protein YiiM
MRTLVRETKHIAGIYARVIEEGQAQEGDEIGFVD